MELGNSINTANQKGQFLNRLGWVSFIVILIGIAINMALFYAKYLDVVLFWFSVTVSSVIILLPYFFVQKKYEKWFYKTVLPMYVDNINREGFDIKSQIKPLTLQELEDNHITQHIHKFDNKFIVSAQSATQTIKISRVECWHHLRRRINNKLRATGNLLPVLNGVYASYSFDESVNLPDVILLSQKMIRSTFGFTANFRLRMDLYKDGLDIMLGDREFYKYQGSYNKDSLKAEDIPNNTIINQLNSVIDLKHLLKIDPNPAISMRGNMMYIIMSGTEYFTVPTKKAEIEAAIKRDYKCINNFVMAINSTH